MDRKLMIIMVWVDIGILVLLAFDVYISYQNMINLQGGHKVV